VKAPITQARLKEVLHYDPETGVFTRLAGAKKANRRFMVGSRAGSLRPDGYRELAIDGTKYRESRLAWLYMTGEHPSCLIDHENHVTDDNRWENLRAATYTQNMQNKGLHKNNTSGVKGVTWYAPTEKWAAHITVGRKMKYLGYFEDIAAAKQFIEMFRNMFHGEFACHG
jgi:hypothetical protein